VIDQLIFIDDLIQQTFLTNRSILVR
jgi:hypothetical protein